MYVYLFSTSSHSSPFTLLLLNLICIQNMFRISNNLIGCLNFLVFLISVPIFAIGIWLAVRGGSSECQKLMQGRAVVLGAILMVVSLAGFIGACFRVTWLMWVYLVLMSLLILLQVCFIVFDLAVTSKGSGKGEGMRGRGYEEYHLEDYSHWFRDQVEDKREWTKIRSCLVDHEVCKDLQESSETYSQFFKSKLSPIESGCCKPPAECGFVYQKPTVWTAPPTGFSSTNLDCKAWNNNTTTLCFDCNSCKAGVIAETKKAWKATAIVHAVLIFILIIVYAVGCHALKNNKEDNAIKLKGFV